MSPAGPGDDDAYNERCMTDVPQQRPPDELLTAPTPRERMAELIGEAGAARARRERLQGWVIGAGIALVALGLPGERLWGDMELARQTAGNGERSAGIVFPLAVLVRHGLGVDAELACRLLAAVSYGLCVPALVGLLRSIGFDHLLALLAALTALLAPTAWIAGSMPLDFAPGMLGATLVLWALFRPRERVANGYHWRAATSLALAFLLRPENALLFPAVLWAVSRHRGLGRLRGPSAGLVLALATALPLFGLVSGAPERTALGWRLLDTVLAGREPSLQAAPRWILALGLGLGAGVFGLYVLLLGRRLPEETPPPKWVVPWCLVVLAPVAGGRPEAGPVGAYLIPAAAVGIADWLTRTVGEKRALRRGSALLAVQLGLTAAVTFAWRASDPLADWRHTARLVLDPADVVVAADPRHGYLAGVRFRLATYPAPAEGPADQVVPAELLAEIDAGTRRLVAAEGVRGGVAGEKRWPTTGAVLGQRAVHVLTETSLVRLGAGERYAPLPR